MTLKMNRFAVKFATLAQLLFPLFLIYPCFAQGDIPELPDPGKTSISREQQEQLGFKTAQQVYQQMPVLPDSSQETQYIRKIGNRLLAVIPQAQSWPYQFHVVAEKDINAFALPGGEVFVNLGAITAAANESQLAGVMAHEMSHVYMQHSAKQMQKAELTQGLAGLAGAILGNAGGMLGALGQTGIQIGAGMVMLKYSRSDEAQADAVGAIILYRAGYNPMALADFFKTLEAQGGAPPQFLSDHPNPGNREEAIQREIRNWPPKNYISGNSDFAAARRHALKVKAYTADEIAKGAKTSQWTDLNRKNGAVLQPPPGMSVNSTGEAAPSGSTTTADTTDTASAANTVSWSAVAPSQSFVFTDVGFVRLVRPQNWQVMAPQQQGQSITIAPSAGVVNNGVGYGVVINSADVASNSTNLDQVTDQIVRSFESGENGLQPISKTTTISVGGLQGRSVLMESTSPFADANGHSQKERDHLVTIQRPDGTVVYFVFVVPVRDYDRINPTFDRMLKSVQF